MNHTDNRPPGAHIYDPEVEWRPPAVPFRNLATTFQKLDTAVDHAAPEYAHMRAIDLPIGMIEPGPDHGRLTPWVFWAIVGLAFACVLARAAGWL